MREKWENLDVCLRNVFLVGFYSRKTSMIIMKNKDEYITDFTYIGLF